MVQGKTCIWYKTIVLSALTTCYAVAMDGSNDLRRMAIVASAMKTLYEKTTNVINANFTNINILTEDEQYFLLKKMYERKQHDETISPIEHYFFDNLMKRTTKEIRKHVLQPTAPKQSFTPIPPPPCTIDLGPGLCSAACEVIAMPHVQSFPSKTY